MAKKTQKGKPAKKVAKPAKKAVAKKPAKKAVVKKTVKKAAKPAKKVAPKKVVKKVVKKAAPKKANKQAKKVVAKKIAKPAKKVIAKKIAKPAKKVIAKKAVKPAKKVLAKKALKPAKKVAAKKVIKPAKKIVAKPIAKKIIAKPVAKPIAKIVAKPIAKVVAKVEVKKVIPAKPAVAPKPSKVKEREMDLDDDGSRRNDDAPLVIEYKTPSIRKPMGPAPKPHINTDTRTRYSDAELKEFKELILKKLSEAQKDFELLKSTLSHKDDHGTDDTSPTFKLLEDGSDVLSKEETSHLAGRQEKFIQNLQNALIRIENKTYGICRATGKLISKERLRSVPHATLAIEAKLNQN